MIKINNKRVESFKFSGGELQVNIKNILNEYKHLGLSEMVIEADILSSDDLIELLLVVDAIKRRLMNADIRLHILYLPYARQDRVCSEGEALSLKVICDLINSLNFSYVLTADVHSSVSSCLLNKHADMAQYKLISSMLRDIGRKTFVLISPDKGAAKKIYDVYNNNSNIFTDVIICDKLRCPKTGNILETTIPEIDLSGKDLFIADDICDGGRTFIELAKKLKEKNPKSLTLYVTHGLFSKGLDELIQYFDKIYCYNLLKDVKHEKLIITRKAYEE
jgi:ribose-phosphate pyrophosphokinase